MDSKPLRADLLSYLKKHGLVKKFTKQIQLFNKDHRHPSLHTERLAPKEVRIYSFRIDLKYRALFIITPDGQAEIIDINNHYK